MLMETLEQCVRFVQSSYKDNKTMLLISLRFFIVNLLTDCFLTDFTRSSVVSIVEFEQINAGRVSGPK